MPNKANIAILNWKDYAKEEIFSGVDDVMEKIQARPVPHWDSMM